MINSRYGISLFTNTPYAQVVGRKKTTMAGPITKEYISTTSKIFVSNGINGKMIKKNFIEIEGTFLLNVHDNTFFGNDAEDVFKHINSAASEWFTKECIGTVSTWDDLVERFVLKFYNLCDHEETKDNNDPDVIDNVPEIFKINDDLFKFDSPLCLAFKELNHLLKINPDLYTYETQKIKTYEEYEQKLNKKHKVSWNHGQRIGYHISYVIMNYKASNIGRTQENYESKGNLIPEPSNFRVRRFKMMKYTFTDNEEYITVKESEYLNHSKDSLEAYQELLRLINEGWVVTTQEK
nr:hypothetical protein [Tanacetum cinerariifolium]